MIRSFQSQRPFWSSTLSSGCTCLMLMYALGRVGAADMQSHAHKIRSSPFLSFKRRPLAESEWLSWWSKKKKKSFHCASIDLVPAPSNQSTSCCLKPARSHEQSPVISTQSWQRAPSMNCRGVNSGSVWERCGGRVMSARLRHYDAAPYLTMLLFLRALCSRMVSGEERGEREDGEGGKQRASERWSWSGIKMEWV